MVNVFLDNAATTKTDPEVVKKMLPYFSEIYGNPSGFHAFARQAKEALDEARETVAGILNCKTEEIIFTAGGTESDNLAIFGAVKKNATKEKNHLITSKIEHHAVLHPFEKLEKEGFEVTYLSPDKDGKITPEIFKKALKKNTLFASIMYANNEIGTISDIPQLAKIAKDNNVIFHTDACQAGGTLDMDTEKLGVDLLTLNGSKIYGPKGVGLLFKNKNINIEPQILGGAQENNLRAGTENIPGIIGFVEALKIAQNHRKEENMRLAKLQNKMIDFVLSNIPLSRLNGHEKDRLPNNIHLSFLNTEGESLLLFLDNLGFAVSTTSACTSFSLDPSHVLLGIGLPKEVAHGSLRITLGKYTTEKQVDDFLKALKEVVEKVRKMSPVHFDKSDFPELF